MKNKRLGWGIGAAIGIAVLVLFSGWFWSLGEVHAGAPPAIRIEPVTQPVEFHHADQTEWTTLAAGMDAAPGDSIRTGEGGEARIVWGDRGATRVDAGSELTLETIPEDGSLSPGATIQMKLEGGRIWTRVIKLLDLGSSMQVEASNVVATVRGTSFGAAHLTDGAQFAVTQSVVAVRGSNSTSTLLRDNQWGDFGLDGRSRTVRDLNETDAWAVENRAQDSKEEQDTLHVWSERVKARAAFLDRGPSFLVNASESLHLAFSGDEAAKKLGHAYAERRLAQRFADRNDVPTAFRQHMRASRLERASISLADRAYLDAVAIDDRIDDALARPSGRDDASLPGIRADLISFESKIDTLDISSNEKDGLHLKTEALHARIDNLGPAPVLDIPAITSPEAGVKAGTQIFDTAKPKPSVIKPPTTTTQPVVYQRLQLLASPSTVVVGQSVTLKLFGITSAGQADDITSKGSFSTPGPGSISGNSFVPSAIGIVTINAGYDGRVSSAQITVTKAAPVVTTGLQSIAFQFTGPTTMACSARTPFKIIAKYADGKTADVTILSKLSVTDSKLIFVSSDGMVSSFCTVSVATAYVNASYTEGQVTKTASAAITVTRDTSAVSSDCTGRQCP